MNTNSVLVNTDIPAAADSFLCRLNPNFVKSGCDFCLFIFTVLPNDSVNLFAKCVGVSRFISHVRAVSLDRTLKIY